MSDVQPNLLDRLVTYAFPRSGLERLQSRKAMSMYGSYTGGRYDRRQTADWFTSRGSADADTLLDLPTLRSRSRDLNRNSPLAAGAIHTVVQNAVGTGLSLQPTPDLDVLKWDEAKAIAWSSLVGHEFALWAESPNCDVTRTQNFYGLQSTALRGALESGDILALLPMKSIKGQVYKTRVQLIEADRLHTPGGGEGMEATYLLPNANGIPIQGDKTGNRIYGGVEVDASGAPVAYCILKQHPGAIGFIANAFQYDRVPAFGTATNRRNVVHLFDRTRPDQNRGVPYLAPVLESFKQLDRYTEAEIMRAVVSSMFTVFVRTDTGEQAFPSDAPAISSTSFAQQNDISLGPGKVVGLAPGEDVTFPSPSAPNPGFDPFVISILRQIGVGLQLPFEILVKHFTSSYSAARAALLEAWKYYSSRRAFIASQFCQPIFEVWMDEAVSAGRIEAPGYFSDPVMRRAYLSCDWIGDAPGSIDPQKEVAASIELVTGGFSNHKIETMRLTGRNWSDVHLQLVREHEMRVAAGLEPAVTNAVATEMVTPPGAPPATAPPVAPNVPVNPVKPAPKKPAVKP